MHFKMLWKDTQAMMSELIASCRLCMLNVHNDPLKNAFMIKKWEKHFRKYALYLVDQTDKHNSYSIQENSLVFKYTYGGYCVLLGCVVVVVFFFPNNILFSIKTFISAVKSYSQLSNSHVDIKILVGLTNFYIFKPFVVSCSFLIHSFLF